MWHLSPIDHWDRFSRSGQLGSCPLPLSPLCLSVSQSRMPSWRAWPSLNSGGPAFGQGYMRSCAPLVEPPNMLTKKSSLCVSELSLIGNSVNLYMCRKAMWLCKRDVCAIVLPVLASMLWFWPSLIMSDRRKKAELSLMCLLLLTSKIRDF